MVCRYRPHDMELFTEILDKIGPAVDITSAEVLTY